MDNQNPTGGNSGASTADPIDRFQALLDAENVDSNNADSGNGDPKALGNTDDPKEGDQGKTQEPQFTTAHLATFLGVDPESIDVDEEGQPVFKLKVDGKEQTAKFKDFHADYQKGKAADNRLREAAERERAAERKMQEAEQAITAKLEEQQRSLQHTAQFAQILMHDLQQERQSHNWAQLWQDNPGQAKQLEMHYDGKQQRIAGILQQLAMRNQAVAKQAEEAKTANEKKAMEAQERRLLSLIPEWRDHAVGVKEMQEIRGWLDKSGFDAEDLKLQSATTWYALRKAWQHDTLQASKPEVVKKLTQAPKLIRAGTPQTTTVQEASVKGLKAELKKTGGKGNKTFEELLMATGRA